MSTGRCRRRRRGEEEEEDEEKTKKGKTVEEKINTRRKRAR